MIIIGNSAWATSPNKARADLRVRCGFSGIFQNMDRMPMPEFMGRMIRQTTAPQVEEPPELHPIPSPLQEDQENQAKKLQHVIELRFYPRLWPLLKGVYLAKDGFVIAEQLFEGPTIPVTCQAFRINLIQILHRTFRQWQPNEIRCAEVLLAYIQRP